LGSGLSTVNGIKGEHGLKPSDPLDLQAEDASALDQAVIDAGWDEDLALKDEWQVIVKLKLPISLVQGLNEAVLFVPVPLEKVVWMNGVKGPDTDLLTDPFFMVWQGGVFDLCQQFSDSSLAAVALSAFTVLH